jgi:hypothetical protein
MMDKMKKETIKEEFCKGCHRELRNCVCVHSQQITKVNPKAVTASLNSGAQGLVLSANDTKTADTNLKSEVLREVEWIPSNLREIEKAIDLTQQKMIEHFKEVIDKFKERINRFGFRADNRANIIIRRQVLEILDEELKKELEK